MVNWIEDLKRNLVKYAIIVDSLDEKDEADAQSIKLREEACKSCDKNVNNVCQVCECYIDLKVRSKVNRNKLGKKEITHCPMGKWDDKLILTYIKNF
jgi:hypothetical protein